MAALKRASGSLQWSRMGTWLVRAKQDVQAIYASVSENANSLGAVLLFDGRCRVRTTMHLDHTSEDQE